MEFLLIVVLTVSSYVDSTAIDKRDSSDEYQPWKIPYLPQTTQPVRYDLHLTPDFYGDASTFSGQISMRFKVVKDTKTILVHFRNLEITETALRICSEDISNVSRAFQYEQYWVVQTNESMQSLSDCTHWLGLSFRGNLRQPDEEFFFDDHDPVFGFYKGKYVDKRTGKERSVFSSYSRITKLASH